MKFDAFDILDMFGVNYINKEGAIRINCPFCEGKKSFGITRGGSNDSLFNCFSCGVSGHTLQLYCLFKGVEIDMHNEEKRIEMIKEINQKLGLTFEKYFKADKREKKKELKELEMAGIEHRNNTYQQLLDILPLKNEHFISLKNRGLTDDMIKKNQYRSAVDKGVELILKKLQSSGCQFLGVPGFYRKETGEWTLSYLPSGIIIPTRDDNNKIKGIVIRLDNPKDGNKYISLSSVEKKQGVKGDASCHIVGGPDLTKFILTEGNLKSDIAFQNLEMPVVGLQGVRNINSLEKVLEKHKEVKKIYIGIDQDRIENKFVYEGFKNITNLLEKKRINYKVLVWNSHYKGIDDYLVKKNNNFNSFS
ncbi:MAG: DUF3854 domain-containing protein [Eubacteriaceae bacterium]